MFFNRAIEMKLVKTAKKQKNEDTTRSALDFEQINKIAQDQVRNLAMVVVGLYAVKVALDTTSEIVVNKTTHN